ncbi:MAG: MFS transporter [Candidatus Latescibacteria bacterium]|nr:MFS transporter [Candidatus Latescibacterota bacterium]MBT4140309.1 MFS transporter [Candidatus Latescibacterota bacterium]MBT5828569.1 MFS transporter [Candidatus Latescibacterota bacterium]
MKNQRYFEPFLILIFLDKGLSFFFVGLLVAFREAVVNLFEIPSGAIADVWGRRRSMVLSYSAYITSFLIFGLANGVAVLFIAMFFFAIGDAFRSGTHKAMIFTWLRLQGREKERTKVYGYTRSWSKFGSALSVILSALFVYAYDSYNYVFYCSIVPYVLGIINLLGYPAQLDGTVDREISFSQMKRHLKESFKEAFGNIHLRRLLAESVGFQGAYHVAKDYLQPVLKGAALIAVGYWFASDHMSDIQKSTLLVGPVYLLLYLLAGFASRNAHRVVTLFGHAEKAAYFLWASAVLLFFAMFGASFFQLEFVLIVVFVLLDALQNLWRPVQLGRLDTHGNEEQGALLLSIESQMKRVSTMVMAPLMGLAVDVTVTHHIGGPFWPVGLFGLLVTVLFLWTGLVAAKKRLVS